MRVSFLKALTCLLCGILLAGVFILPALSTSDESPVIEGDASRLTVDKSVYEEGEPIMISGVGSGYDWLGIYRVGAPHSIRWTYVDTALGGPGSGVEVNIRMSSNVNATEPIHIPAGTYIVRLMPNDSSDLSLAIAWTTITVVPSADAGKEIAPPVSATYELNDPDDGFAAGTVTVNMPADELKNRCLVMYWADENGKLENYTSLPMCKVTGETTEFTFGNHVIIPAGATRLLIYAMSDITGNMSESCLSVDLPAGAAHAPLGNSIADLFVMSDIHITVDPNHVHNKNFSRMLEDVASLNQNALGIFVVGDTADTGREIEYQNMQALYALADNVPPLFLAIGNHDVSSLPFDQANALFLKYATLPDGTHPTDTSYDFWLGGYHFIFLGTDHAETLKAGFDKRTMVWLEEKINENRDPARPVFLFLHQSLENTVSGSLPGEGWSGVTTEKILRKALEDYPEVMFFNGHSHWTMDSVGNMFEGNDELPCRIFNCASVAYLWSGYNVVTGEHLNGSQGYMVRLYDGKLYVLGRDFSTGQWIPAAQYCITLKEETPPPAETTSPVDTDVPTEPADTTPDTDPPDTDTTADTSADTSVQAPGGCGSLILPASLLLCAAAYLCLRRREE